MLCNWDTSKNLPHDDFLTTKGKGITVVFIVRVRVISLGNGVGKATTGRATARELRGPRVRETAVRREGVEALEGM